MRTLTKLLKNPVLNVVLAIVILGALAFFVDLEQIRTSMTRSTPLYWLLALACLAASLGFVALRFFLLLRSVSLHMWQPDYLFITCQGSFYNLVLPTGLGGEALRFVNLRNRFSAADIASALFADRLVGLVCLCGVSFVMMWMIEMPPAGRDAVFWVTLGVALLCVVLFFVQRRIPALAGIAKISRDLITERDGYLALLFSGLFLAMHILAFYLVLLSFGFDGQWTAVAALVPVILVIQQVPLTLGGWGTREAAAGLLLPLAGATFEQSVVGSIVFGLGFTLASFIGVIFFGWARK